MPLSRLYWITLARIPALYRWSLVLMLLGACATTGDVKTPPPPANLTDATRNRQIPLEIYPLDPSLTCTVAQPCGVAFLSPGYGISHTEYSFVARALNQAGYLVVAIQHVLPTDEPLATTGDVRTDRMPMWKRGAENLRFVRNTLAPGYPLYDWAHLMLVGHSNGGDISALALTETPTLATTLITLDHRRYPLPQIPGLRVLSLRGSDFEADPGVLPSEEERIHSGMCIIPLEEAHHDEMTDLGPPELKVVISSLIFSFVAEGTCGG